ncbi:MAG: polysaccharide (de)acetylase [Saprospiraceae bacterium]
MISKLKQNLAQWVKGSLGWKTNRKIVVFESDDWGSIRMPSNKVYDSLLSKGIRLDSHGGNLFNRFDTLADEDDLTALFEVLHSVRDKNENPAVFTAVSVVANPDFEKMEKNAFDQYYYEPFTQTLEKYQGHNRTFALWKEGLQNKVFFPESHSREHLNTLLWVENLQKGDQHTRIAFDHGMWAFDRLNNKPSYQIAFNVSKQEDLTEQKKIVTDGLRLFEELFGYKASFFVPPNGLFHPSLEKTTYESGISSLYASFIYQIPIEGNTTKNTFRYLGQTNEFNQKYILRNCLFEPNEPGLDWLGIALKDIETAFSYRKPAILGPHRKNFIGCLNENNRKNSLSILKKLLKKIVEKWPDVEFMTTRELIALMK